MMRAPQRTRSAIAAVAVAAVTLTGCGGTPAAGPATTAATSAGASSSFPAGASPAAAEAGSLRLDGGWVVATAPLVGRDPSSAASSPAASGMPAGPTMATSAAYAVIHNAGDTDDALVSVSTPAAGEAQLHTTVENSSGGGTMKRVESIPVPAHGGVALQMGGYHVMLMNLTRPLGEGDTLTMTWTFRSGTSITTAFPVISREHRPGA